jgi:hypothetical protein
MSALNEMLLDHPSVQQLIQNLRRLGVDSDLDIHDGYLTLTIRLFATHTSNIDATKDTSMESEALLKKKKFMQSLLGARQRTVNTDFLTPR